MNDPKRFAVEAVEGFAAANPQHLLAVPGGVVRSSASPSGEVAVVLGGGSGHYPAFAGWVGQGMAHGAVCGNVFASPSASQVRSVVRAADNGGGVLLGFGNYAGDVLHFGQAAEQLRAEGVDVRIITVTDDVASGPADEPELRRGIAGDLMVFKVAGAAAARGDSLDAVEAVTRRANARTRTLGLAFGGCTLPGADGPLFDVPEGLVAVGLGIHGEPGISEAPLGTADDLADLLVEGVLAEEPERGDGYGGRVAVLLNGLGATKYEELFVVYRRVAERLAEHGLDVVSPEVGEHVTSLDMAGLSLTVMFCDDELVELWTAPVDTPAVRRHLSPAGDRTPREISAAEVEDPVVPGVPASREAAAAVLEGLRRALAVARESENELGDLDAVAGDGDHGQGMVLGTAGAVETAQEVTSAGAGVRTTLLRSAAAWSDSAGGTSGALWGAALAAAAGALDDGEAVSPQRAAEALERARDAVLRLGGAQPGDKTMLDAFVPFVAAVREGVDRDGDLPAAWRAGADAAADGAAATSEMAARTGRARAHGNRSIGHPDPGAVSFARLVEAALRTTIPDTTQEDR
ncbi:dihydroxyacetone kinase family protein [Actinotalea sp. K2]|uniref:dihydroxyacetone kinase family protein n=1 Tax=Actinotalea sp. K2 TaxID=2939438 RepID=UPI0027E20DBA|nr:dihydroxyacetone kinase family protein [Actinotalea sp. K2]